MKYLIKITVVCLLTTFSITSYAQTINTAMQLERQNMKEPVKPTDSRNYRAMEKYQDDILLYAARNNESLNDPTLYGDIPYERGSWEWLVENERRFMTKRGQRQQQRTENIPSNPFSTPAETIRGSDLGNYMSKYPKSGSIKYNYKLLRITGMVTAVRPEGVMISGTFLPGIYASKNDVVNVYCYGAYSPRTDGWGAQATGKDCKQ